MSELSASEIDSIRRAPVSPYRVQAFLHSFRADREKTRTTEALFKRVHAFREKPDRPQPEEVSWSGFNLLLQKAPFIDLPNWGPYDPWGFAVALEQHLLRQFEQALRQATEGHLSDPVEREAKSVIRALDNMADDLEEGGYAPSLFVLAGPLGTQLAGDMQHLIVKAALGPTFRISGMYRAVSILDIPESPSPGVYAVDVARFARLTRYATEPQFEVKEITRDRAEELLAKNPGLVSDPPPGPSNDEARIQQLQLKVGLQLFETYRLTVLDGNAVVGSPLIGPVLEWQPGY